MIPEFASDGNLPPGVHTTTWSEVVQRFGGSNRRQTLLRGLHRALQALKRAGCQVVYLDGSFVTSKQVPNDFDACWDVGGVNPANLDPTLLDFSAGRAAQKAKYLGELFPAQFSETSSGSPFIEFFQTDRVTGGPKGIVAIDLNTLSDDQGGHYD
jgi:hypothetical protein